MHSQLETITPAQAAEILAHHNPTNRPMSRDRARRYLQEMQNGHWAVSPQGLSFDANGNLVDGQHRLAAVRQLDKPVQFWVTRGVTRDSVRVMDQGLARTAAQIASSEIETEVSTAKLTAAARAILEHGLGATKPSNTTIVEFTVQNQAILERYAKLAQYTAGVHAAFAFAEMQGLKGVKEAAMRLAELRWEGDDDPMRALARALGSMGNREGARAKATRFYTALAALEYTDRGEGLLVARKYDTMPPRVRSALALS
jgi:hypothetical protein